MHRLFVALLVVSLTGLSGCVAPPAPGGEQGLVVVVSPEANLAALGVEIRVTFENTARREFIVSSAVQCLRLDVLVRSPAGQVVPVDDPAEGDCPPGRTEFRVAPGERLEWGPMPFRASEYVFPGGDAVFDPGQHTVEASFRALETSWDTKGEAVLEVLPGEPPVVEVLPEKTEWAQGESVAILLRFENTAPVPLRFTAQDGCDDLHARVLIPMEPRLWPLEGPYSCPQVQTGFEIMVGEIWEGAVVWDGSMDGEGGPPFVPEGRYTIVADLGAVRADWDVSSQVRIDIREP